jgi:hypothetical protein
LNLGRTLRTIVAGLIVLTFRLEIPRLAGGLVCARVEASTFSPVALGFGERLDPVALIAAGWCTLRALRLPRSRRPLAFFLAERLLGSLLGAAPFAPVLDI